MYEVCILSKPDKFTQSVYYEMHNEPIPDNIRWVGYSEYSDCDTVEPDFVSHGRKVVLNRDEQTRLREELDIDDSNRFVVAVIERMHGAATGYVGTIKGVSPSKASENLISLSERIISSNDPSEFLDRYLKNIQNLNRAIKTITKTRVELLSIIPGLSLYVLGQKTKAVIFAGWFILWLCITIYAAFFNQNDLLAEGLSMTIANFCITPFECIFICGDSLLGSDASRVVLVTIIFPIITIYYSISHDSSLSIIIVPLAAGMLIYSLLTVFRKRKRKPLKGIEILKPN